MKKSLLIAVSAILVSSSAFAFLPSTAVSTMSLPVYGVYMSADATCATGLVATVPLSKTPQTINFAANPVIGSGSLPSSIGCVVIVIGNNLNVAWKSGTYTGTSQSNGGGGGPFSDGSCNPGGGTPGSTICHGTNPTWPPQITTDAAAAGLTLQTGVCGSTTDVIPLVLSTNSICTGQLGADSAVPACAGGNVDNFVLPLTSSDPTHGTKLVSPSVTGNLKFVVNPSNAFGGTSSSTCGNLSAPLFSFAAY